MYITTLKQNSNKPSEERVWLEVPGPYPGNVSLIQIVPSFMYFVWSQHNTLLRHPHPNTQNWWLCYPACKRDSSGEIKLRIWRWEMILIIIFVKWTLKGPHKRKKEAGGKRETAKCCAAGLKMEKAPLAQGHGHLQKLEKARSGFSLKPPEGSSLVTPSFQTSDLQDGKIMNLCCFKTPPTP